MHRHYDLFEKFPDGSTLWRGSVLGVESTRIHLRELSQKSGNRFYAIDMATGKIIQSGSERVGPGLLAPQEIGKRSKSAVA